MMRAGLVTALVLASSACGDSPAADVGLEGLALSAVAPNTIVPGTAIAIEGDSFVDATWGDTTLHLVGSGGTGSIDVRWPATFVDFDHLVVPVDRAQLEAVGGDVDIAGEATIEVVSAVDGQTYASAPLPVQLRLRLALTPTVTAIQTDTLTFVNDPIEVEGDGLLLGGDEGTSVAEVSGCFTPESGGGCLPVTPVTVPLRPRTPFDRGAATFAFVPEIAGIQPGTFVGEVVVRNVPAEGASAAAPAVDVSYDLIPPEIFEFAPAAASLGQYVFVRGGGFVGGQAGAFTEIQLEGTFAKNGGAPAPASLTLIPEFVDGRSVRYVVNEDDTLGHALDLRTDTGVFVGTATPVVSWAGDDLTGTPAPVQLELAPVRQVIYLEFQASYVEAMRLFGLRAIDQQIRDRIFAVVERAYAGVNVELRAEPPTDYALYEWVQLLGEDPNNMGLFGYDNSPGKDNGNVRLYDRLGGVNAQTQQDGYPGYGGVFVASLMGFSLHPTAGVASISGADPAFDQIMDAFREDRGGTPVRAADLADGIETLQDGGPCPADDRPTRVACAAFVMGNLIGGTLAHEIGHSLGLANPGMEGFHNNGDAPGRLMDAGGDRPFLERAELGGVAAARLCEDEYQYLRTILPSDAPADDAPRPACF